VRLTSQICKVSESIIRDGMVCHLESNMLIQDSRHGFRKRRSCLTNLLTFLDKVSGCLDSGENMDVVFLDFAKAFDKVPYKRLELKLKSHGITGKLLMWITWIHSCSLSTSVSSALEVFYDDALYKSTLSIYLSIYLLIG